MPLLNRRTDHDVDLRDRADDHARGGHDDRVVDDRLDDRRPVGQVEEQVTATDHQGWNSALRALAVVAGAVPTVMAVIALFRFDWDAGMDAPAVDVAGLAFTPVVALVTLALGVVALIAASSPDRGSKLVAGAVFGCLGLAILLIGDTSRADLDLERGHGWLALFVGAVVLLSGLLLRSSWTTRRRVATDRW